LAQKYTKTVTDLREELTQKGARFVEDLRGKHQGEEIWIIGCAPSLDDFPGDFFDDKITIALNWSILAVPGCTYWHGQHQPYRVYLRDEKPEFLSKSFLPYPFPAIDRPMITKDPVEFFGDLTSLPIWMRVSGTLKPRKKWFEEAVANNLAGKSNVAYPDHWTVAHTAIQIAAGLGAKRIILVGCEHSGDGHAQKRGLGARYGQVKRPSRPICEAEKMATQLLAEILGKHGIEVVRYFHKDIDRPGMEHFKAGYQMIPKEVVEGQ